MNAENRRLREMLSHVNNNYTALQMHLTTLMQKQQNAKSESTQDHEVNLANFYDSFFAYGFLFLKKIFEMLIIFPSISVI